MIIEELRDQLAELGEEYDVAYTLLDNPSFDDSIIGYTDDGKVVYEYESMLIEYCEDNKIDLLDDDATLEAMEFIDYNTMRAIPYMPNPPIIIHDIDELENF